MAILHSNPPYVVQGVTSNLQAARSNRELLPAMSGPGHTNIQYAGMGQNR